MKSFSKLQISCFSVGEKIIAMTCRLLYLISLYGTTKRMRKVSNHFFICVLIVLSGTFFSAYSSQGAEFYKPGFRTIGIWKQEPEMRLDINLWYPASRPTRELNFSPWIINAAPGGAPAPGTFPLIILSHSTAGTRFTYHDTATWLASQGFIVAAPTHPRDSMDNMDDLFTWDQLTGRMENIISTMDVILKDRDISKSIAKDRIGLLGYGAGGTAALFLGGAEPDCSHWSRWCVKSDDETPYCSPRVREGIDKMCKFFPVEKLLADRRIKAIVVVAPAYGMLFGPNSFGKFNSPSLIVATGKDTFNKMEQGSAHLAKFLGDKAHFLELAKADTGAMMAPCPPALAHELPELCLSVREEERNRIHRIFNSAVKDFFDKYLVSGGR